MRRLIGVLLALGLAASVSADAPAVCTATTHSPGTSCSASVASATSQLACSCATTTTAAASNPLSGFFTSFWKLADTSDSIGSNALTDNGGVTFGAGKIGNAVTTSTTGPKYLSRAGLSLSGGSVTVACWVKYSGGGNAYIFSWNGNTAGAVEVLFKNGAGGTFQFYSDVGHIGQSTGVTYNDGNWHLFVFYHTAATHVNTFVVDNGTPDTVAATTDIAATSAAFAIGNFSGGGIPLSAQVDACAIADGKTPSAAQLTAMWNAGAGAEPPF